MCIDTLCSGISCRGMYVYMLCPALLTWVHAAYDCTSEKQSVLRSTPAEFRDCPFAFLVDTAGSRWSGNCTCLIEMVRQ